MVIDAKQTTQVEYRVGPANAQKRRDGSRNAQEVPMRDARAARPSKQAQRVSATKREQRERRQRLLRVRRVAALLLAAAILMATGWGAFSLTRLPMLGIKTVRVEGVRHLKADDVADMAAVSRGSSIVWLSKRTIVRRLLKNPWIEEATVDRDMPATVLIRIRERTPAVAIDTGGSTLWIVSADGRWLGEQSAVDTGTPVVRDAPSIAPEMGKSVDSPEIRNVIEIVRGLSPGLLQQTRFISSPSIEKTALITTDDVQVFIGDSEDIRDKDRIVSELLRKEKGDVVYINVRVVESPTWRGLDQ